MPPTLTPAGQAGQEALGDVPPVESTIPVFETVADAAIWSHDILETALGDEPNSIEKQMLALLHFLTPRKNIETSEYPDGTDTFSIDKTYPAGDYSAKLTRRMDKENYYLAMGIDTENDIGHYLIGLTPKDDSLSSLQVAIAPEYSFCPNPLTYRRVEIRSELEDTDLPPGNLYTRAMGSDTKTILLTRPEIPQTIE